MSTTWAETDAALRGGAWAVSAMDYEGLHSDLLEGYVCSWVPRTPALEAWAAAHR
jgi:hypothetical protein